MDSFIIIILIFGIPAFFFSKVLIDHLQNKNSATKKDDKVTYRYIIELKDDAIGKVQPNDLREVGQFDVFGYSGAGLEGQTHLKQDEFKDYICNKFSISPDLVTVIDPTLYTRRF